MLLVAYFFGLLGPKKLYQDIFELSSPKIGYAMLEGKIFLNQEVQNLRGLVMVNKKKGTATRTRIIDATVDLLITGGREHTGLDDVQARTATSKSQIFYYFPGGKEELIRVATERQVERLLGNEGAWPEEFNNWESWRTWIDRIVHAHREQAEHDACEVAALAGRATDLDRASRHLIGEAFNEWLRRMADGLASMQAAGLLRPDARPQELATALLASIEGGAVIDKATGARHHLGSALEAAYAHLRSFATA
jgi:AcrR family transcriptional regulator